MGAIERVFRGRRGGQERPTAAIVAGLWRNGEQGVWYDPSDLSTMFQDVAGGVPVYMPGQGQPDCWVGLQLDKRRGLTRGPEMLSNGDFSGGTAGWGVAGADATHVVDFAGGACRYKSDTTSPVLTVSQGSLSIVAGRWYELTIVVSSWVSGSVKTDSFNGAAPSGLVLASSAGTFRVIGLATSTTSVFSFLRNGANTDLTIDSISIRELPGNHRWQGTATSRPVLSARYNVLSASEKFDDAYWGFTSNYAVEKTGDVQDPSGGSNAWKITSTTGSAALNKAVGAGFKNPVYTVILRAGSRNPDILVRNATTATNLAGGSVSNPSTSGEYGKFTNADLGGGWRKLTIEITSGVATSDVLIIYLGSTGSVAPGQYFYAYRAEFREGNDGIGLPPYQRVVDANTYDTVGFPLYIRPDGVDDWMQTASVDFSGTSQISLAFALRKLSDGAVGEFMGFSSAPATSPGGFGVLAPPSTNPRLEVSVCGSINGYAQLLSTAPDTAVWSAALDLRVNFVADGKVAVRKNGAAVAPVQVGAGNGTGNFGNYPLYGYRRGGTSLPFSGRDYGTLIVGRLLTGPETAAVEKLLRQKSRAY